MAEYIIVQTKRASLSAKANQSTNVQSANVEDLVQELDKHSIKSQASDMNIACDAYPVQVLNVLHKLGYDVISSASNEAYDSWTLLKTRG